MARKSTQKKSSKKTGTAHAKRKTAGPKRAQNKTAARKGSASGRSKARARKISDSKRDLSVRQSRAAAKSSSDPSRQSGQSALTLLKRDHDLVRKLLSDLESAKTAERRSSLLERIESELKLHTQLEEQIFYPAFHDHARNDEDRKLYFEALEEHHAVDIVLPEVKSADPGTPQFSARVKVLKELVEHHAKEEEDEMFPRTRKLMSDAQLRELGAEIDAQKKAAASGVVDKVASFFGMN
jgi:hypothetical protein